MRKLLVGLFGALMFMTLKACRDETETIPEPCKDEVKVVDGSALGTCYTESESTLYKGSPCQRGIWAPVKVCASTFQGVEYDGGFIDSGSTDDAGNTIVCINQALPGIEHCNSPGQSPVDEDCDGFVNEEGNDCSCGDGYVSNGAGTPSVDMETSPSKGFAPEECDPLDPYLLIKDSCDPKSCKFRKTLKVSAGGEHSCALLTDHRVKCWGHNINHRLGIAYSPDHVNSQMDPEDWWGNNADETGNNLLSVNMLTANDPPDVEVLALDSGKLHSCVLLSNNQVKCWGDNSAGQLGLSHKAPANIDYGSEGEMPYVKLPMAYSVRGICAGETQSCAWYTDNTASCWGSNAKGQLGTDEDIGWSGPQFPSLAAMRFVQLGNIFMLTCGQTHTCALQMDGSVKCWGNNVSGQLGRSDILSLIGTKSKPMANNLKNVPLSGKAKYIAAGDNHTCALLESGALECWGLNSSVQLGNCTNAWKSDGSITYPIKAVSLDSDYVVTQITAGAAHTCALMMSSANSSVVRCWGSNSEGQHCIGNNVPTPAVGDNCVKGKPFAALGSSEPVSISAGGDHTCATLKNGSLKCWGSNKDFQLGLGSPDNSSKGDHPSEIGDNLKTTKLYADEW